MPVPSQGSERLSIFVQRVSILPLSTILIFDFGIVPTACEFYFFVLIYLNNLIVILFVCKRAMGIFDWIICK
jgi:hypothetical protein